MSRVRYAKQIHILGTIMNIAAFQAVCEDATMHTCMLADLWGHCVGQSESLSGSCRTLLQHHVELPFSAPRYELARETLR